MKKLLLKTIVVPWDYSDMSKNALEAALEMVDSPDMIDVIHVTSYPSTMEPGVVWGVITEDSIVENLEKSFREVADKAGWPELNFTAVFGDPGTKVVDFAKEKDAGLIIIS